jgi:nitroreductase
MDLYEAILARRSVRRYEQRSLGAEARAQVKEAVAAVRPLVDENGFAVLYHDVAPGEDLVQALGAYGRIVTPPHYLVPYLLPEQSHPGGLLSLTDLGFRVQQIAVRLAQAGIGSCFVGCLPREGAAQVRFRLPKGARVGAALIYGYPATGRGNRLIDATMRRGVGAARKLAPERIFYDGAFERASLPPPDLAPLIEAARAAPSADNAQPWRFLWVEDRLWLYVLKQSWRYRVAGTQDYRWYDGGLCMANVSLALEALGRERRWSPLGRQGTDGQDVAVPPCPDELEPLALLELS